MSVITANLDAYLILWYRNNMEDLTMKQIFQVEDNIGETVYQVRSYNETYFSGWG